jgi:hypothetical protein
MRDNDIDKRVQNIVQPESSGDLSPLELLKMHGGKAHKVRGMAGRGVDSMIAVYKDRFTYTFVLKSEVASIHFDRIRNKIFYSGHNIENMTLSDEQKAELHNIINVLEADAEGRELKSAYLATLGHSRADNK